MARRVLVGAAMHPIVFQAKRLHLRTVAFGHRVLRKVEGMTAARFDLLCLVRQAALWRDLGDPRTNGLLVGMSQLEITRRLDLCRTTVSKMLTRLEQMGWVRRVQDTKDKRRKRVFFTALGLRQTAHAMRIVFRQRKLLARFELIARKRWPYKKDVVRALQDLWIDLDFLAGAFADQSMVHYHMGIDEPAGCEWPETPEPTWFLEERSQRWVKPPPPPERWPARPWIPAR